MITSDELFNTAKDLFLKMSRLTEAERNTLQKNLESRTQILIEKDENAENSNNVLEGVILTMCFDLIYNFDWEEVKKLTEQIDNKGVA